MPTYEYQCDACQHNFDEFQQFSDKQLKKCPKCGKRKLRRIFGTGSAVIFKGSGFHQTDYRSESYKAGAKAEETAKAGNAGKTEAAGPAKSGDSAASAAPTPTPAAKSDGKSSKTKD
jgi:putative FmdB family regulatory protein